MAGNSARRGAIKKTGKGNPTAGSGRPGRSAASRAGARPRRRRTAPDHKAYKAQERAEKAAPRPQRRRRKGGDSEWIAGRNSVVEALRASMPVTAVYVAEGAERDGRLREVVPDRRRPRHLAARGDPRPSSTG